MTHSTQTVELSQLTAPNITVDAANGISYAFGASVRATTAGRRSSSCSISGATSTTGTPYSSTPSLHIGR